MVTLLPTYSEFAKTMLDTNNTIEVQGARVHNLKNIDVFITC
jgi:excinuclease ABC subunit A